GASARAAVLAEGVLRAMMMTKIKAAAEVVVALGIVAATCAMVALRPAERNGDPTDGPRPNQAAAADQGTGKRADFDEVTDVLHIYKKSARVTLRGGYKSTQVVMDLYKDGRKLPRTINGSSVSSAAPQGDLAQLLFCLQAVDTDYLTLAGGQRNHCRLM